MTRIPGSSYLILLIYFVLTAVACLAFFGILPMLVLLFGFFMANRNHDVEHIRSAGRFLTGWYALLAVGAFLFALVNMGILMRGDRDLMWMYEHYHRDAASGSAVLAGVLAFGWALSRFVLLPAFLPYGAAIAADGLWGRRHGASRAERSTAITGSEGLRQFSVADELLKWTKLRETGAVSEAQFEAAKQKLLGTA